MATNTADAAPISACRRLNAVYTPAAATSRAMTGSQLPMISRTLI
ncbi:hypothetical protein QFZ43_004154 [Streptomyces afghaniensis]|nr:hypothetical protein [Streptomyces afghaniensis]MDQ1017605.1 hypothetical protein [Streptomyces afghaniensis]